MDFDQIYEAIDAMYRLSGEEEMTAEVALDMLKEEIKKLEYEQYI